MSTQRVWVSKGLPTHRAQVGLPSMGDEVAPQFRQLGKGVSTVWAVVRALPHMQPQVPMQAAPLAECPASVGTGRASPLCAAACGSAGSPGSPGAAHTQGTGMGQGQLAVQSQRGPTSKGLATLVTGKGPST